MDRATIQYGQLSLETDLLRAQQYAMIGVGKLFEAIVGTSIAVDGFSTVPTAPASMSVNIGPGQVYQQANLEASPWSSLPADLVHTIVKQGILLDTATQTFVAPTTVGYAQNFLIQVAYSDADSGLVVRPYYNASNPSVPFNGPGNSGTQDSSVRAGFAALSVKAGVAATSGSQTTPTPDAGYAGLYVVTVGYGQTTITAGNISLYPGAPFIVKLGAGTTSPAAATVVAQAAKTGFNTQIFQSSTRVLLSQSGANVLATALSGLSYTKKSATSLVRVSGSFIFRSANAPGNGYGPTYYVLSFSGQAPQQATSNAYPAVVSLTPVNLTFGTKASPIAAGTYSFMLQFGRNDTQSWSGTFLPSNTDEAGYPPSTLFQIAVDEVEPT